MNELKKLIPYLFKYKWSLILGAFITILSKYFALFGPKLIGDTVNILENTLKENVPWEEVRGELIMNLLLLMGAAFIAATMTFLMRQTIIKVSRYIEFDLKNDIYKHYQKLTLNFYKTNRTGDLMSRISEDVNKVRMFAGPAIMYSLNTGTLFIVVLIYMFSKSVELTLYTLTPLPLLSFFIYKLSNAIHRRTTAVQESLSDMSAFTQEQFSGIAVIKSFLLEPQVSQDFDDLAENHKQKQLNLYKVQALFFPLMILLIGLSNLIVIYIGGTYYMNGKIEHLGTIIEFVIFVNLLTWPVATVGWVTALVQEAEASQKRINAFWNIEPEIKSQVGKTMEVKGKIEFKNVNFTYPDTGVQALKNVSFVLNPGKSLAVLGKTGAGKSTLLDLICRLYDVDSGEILIDGINIKKWHLHNYRKQLGYVPQDSFLFSDTIKENIKFGFEEATDEDIIRATKNADVHHNIIDFNKGYNTLLGERGVTLSGGQKQRICIARAIVKYRQILLFDDCLSAVDTETEEVILNNLQKLSAQQTLINVSHRVSSAINAHHILVLEEGEIIQEGNHEQLVYQEGFYKDLYTKQLQEESEKKI